MAYLVTAGHVESQSIAVVRLRSSQADLPKVIPDACGRVWNFVRSNKIAGAGRHVALYLDNQINIECGVEAPPVFVSDGDVILSATPAGLAAHAAHIGAYHLLGQAHKAILAWCAQNNYTPSGPNWEIYGHWTDDPEKLRTDVFYLIGSNHRAS